LVGAVGLVGVVYLLFTVVAGAGDAFGCGPTGIYGL
jgi:hypothetical protein